MGSGRRRKCVRTGGSVSPSRAKPQEEASLGQFCFLAALETGPSWMQLELAFLVL